MSDSYNLEDGAAVVAAARELRYVAVKGMLILGIIDEAQAKEILSGALSPGDERTVVDDSALLGDPDALNKIASTDKDGGGV